MLVVLVALVVLVVLVVLSHIASRSKHVMMTVETMFLIAYAIKISFLHCTNCFDAQN